jgi:chromosome partitioning protein
MLQKRSRVTKRKTIQPRSPAATGSRLRLAGALPNETIHMYDRNVLGTISLTQHTGAKMPVVIGFVSEKGGVGKTTTCYHVACALQWFHQKRVLVVDTDYQRGGITCRFIPTLIEDFRSGKLSGTTLFDKFQQLYSGGKLATNIDILDTPEHVKLIPADPRLATVTVEKMPATNNIRENTRRLWEHLAVIRNVLEPVGDDFDFVLIDSHPEISDLLRSVAYACDYCVSPVKLDLQSAIGVPSAMQAINEVNSDVEMITAALGPIEGFKETQFTGAIGMMAREWGGILKATERVEFRRLERTGGVFKAYVTEGDGLRQAAQQRCAVFTLSGANADKQSAQLRALTEELIAKCPPR